MELRPYQQQALDDLWSWFAKHDDGNPIVEAAVGAGKSVMIAALAQRAHSEAPGTRVLVLVHQKELLDQNVAKIRAIWPQADVGIYSASHGRKQAGNQIIFATIGSIWKKAHELGDIGIVLADEAHLINPKEAGMWRTFLRDLFAICRSARVIGWTGTPFRGNGVWLTAGDEPLFTHIAAKVTMRQLLDQHYLAPLTPARTATRIDASQVRTSGDDYVISELAKVTDQDHLVQATADEIVRLAADRKRWLVFAVTVEHATHMADALKARGITADVVSAVTPKAERARLIAGFRAGQIRALVNVAVLTTGFDVPEVDFIALLRATKSPVLYVQILGRGMRTADLKNDCLVADFTDTVERLGPVDAIKGRLPTKAGAGEAPFKLCPDCGSRNQASAAVCVDCGYEFPQPERIKHGSTALTAALLSTQVAAQPIEWYEVSKVDYSLHAPPGKTPSLRADYWDGLRIVASEWCCLSHSGYARDKAVNWWRQRAPQAARDFRNVPTAEQAMEWIKSGYQLTAPKRIAVQRQGKFLQVISHEFERTQSDESSAAQVAA